MKVCLFFFGVLIILHGCAPFMPIDESFADYKTEETYIIEMESIKANLIRGIEPRRLKLIIDEAVLIRRRIIEIKGQVVTVEKKEPIPIANIYYGVLNSKKDYNVKLITSTDNNGEFSVSLKIKNANDVLVVSCMGYTANVYKIGELKLGSR